VSRGLLRGRTEGGGASRAEVFDLLSNRRRRHALHYLRQEDRPVGLYELSEQLSAWENGVSRDAVTHKQRKRVYTALKQTHLPRMDEAGVVEFDVGQSVVEPGNLDDVQVYLDVVPEGHVRRSEFYLALGAVGAALLVVAWLGYPPFDLLPPVAWAFGVVAVVLVAAAFDLYRDRARRLGHGGPPPEVEAEK